MSDLALGRRYIRARVDAMSDPDPDPRLDAVAHVICAMGGHIPNRDPEAPGSCVFHRKIAAVAVANLDTPARVIPSRRTDPVTSKAAEPGPLKAGTQRAALLAAFGLQAAADGLTDEEAADLAEGVPYRSEFAKRCSELRAAGWIVPVGRTRPGVAGHERIVCAITDAGRTVLERLDAPTT